MKKVIPKIGVVILIVLIIVLFAVIYWKDNTRQVEEYYPGLKEKFEDIPLSERGGIDTAYTLEREQDKIVITFYGVEDVVKNIVTYYINNGVVSKIHYEVHYTVKFGAKIRLLQYYKGESKIKPKIRGNVVSYYESNTHPNIGKTAEALYKELDSMVILRLDK